MRSKRVSFDIELDLFGSQLKPAPSTTAATAAADQKKMAEEKQTSATAVAAAFQTHVIVRPWVGIPLASEFRAFVHSGKLCAVSQYCTQCYFPSIVHNRQTILKKVWVSMHSKLPSIHLLAFCAR